jgi:hypothetical protein
MVRHWNDLFGYIIQPKRNLPAIVIMSGAGDNGKTVLIRTVMRLLGHDLVHAQRVEDLDKSRFAMGSLFGKYLFVDDDVRADKEKRQTLSVPPPQVGGMPVLTLLDMDSKGGIIANLSAGLASLSGVFEWQGSTAHCTLRRAAGQ